MRRKAAILAIYIIAITLIQSTLLDYIKVYDIKPNLSIIFIVAVALLRGNVEGAVIGFFTGLMQDIISGKVIGIYALLGMYLGFVMGCVNKRLYRENIIISIIFTFLATIFYEAAVFMTVILSGTDNNILFVFRNIILPEAIYNSIMTIPVYFISIRLNHRLEDMIKSLRKY